MSKTIPKQKILEAVIKKQQDLIDSFESRVAEMKDDAYNQSQSASQTENRTAGKIELLGSMENELGFAKMEMGYLKTINPEIENEVAEPGAVVVTDKRTFFVAVSGEGMEVDGEAIFVISTRAPLYKVMAGHKQGETFEFNGTSYKIEALY